MVKRPMESPAGTVDRLNGGARPSNSGVPAKGGNGGDDEPGPLLQAGWKLFGSLSRGQTILILAVGSWVVLALMVIGIFSLLD